MELISVHIPKTAGTYFKRILQQAYKEEAVFFDYSDKVLDPQSLFNSNNASWQEIRNKQISSINKSIKVIHGHFSLSKYDGVFHDAKRIAWVRHPVARLISHYNFWKRTIPDGHTLHKYVYENNVSLSEFAKIPMMQNVVSRVFLKGWELKDLFFVGIQEYFNEDLKCLIKNMGWKVIKLSNEKINTSKQVPQIDRNIRSEIESLNAQDIKLYENALTIRNNRR